MRWAAIYGYEGYYEVSDTGLVRSVDRVVERKDGTYAHYKSRVLKVSRICNARENKYSSVCLSKHGKSETYPVSRLVWDAFANRFARYVCHRDGNPHNNKFNNLRGQDCAGNHHAPT